ncbi:MAG: SH3 domain-containing protein [Lachnospiraceae bacterium]|nr:SH3 domain-containing protein [Lachnospiraceae bacterium]
MRFRRFMLTAAAGLAALAITSPAMATDFEDLPFFDEEDYDDETGGLDAIEEDEVDIPDTADDDTEEVPTLYGEDYDDTDDVPEDYDGTPLSGTGTVITTANFRSTPSKESSGNIIGCIPAGTVVPVTFLTDSGWYKVTYAGQRGYVSEKCLVPEGTESSGETPLNNADVEVTTMSGVVKEQANFRREPGYDSEIIGAIDPGVTVDVIGETESGWYKVYYRGQTGYIYHGLIDTGKKNEGSAHVTVDVNFRSEPDPSSSGNIIGGIPAGAKITVLESTYNNWYKVRYNGVTGYVYGAYIAF